MVVPYSISPVLPVLGIKTDEVATGLSISLQAYNLVFGLKRLQQCFC